MRFKQPTKQTSVLQAKQLFRVSHFNPVGIALRSFFNSICLTIVDVIKICFSKNDDVQANAFCNHQGRIIRAKSTSRTSISMSSSAGLFY